MAGDRNQKNCRAHSPERRAVLFTRHKERSGLKKPYQLITAFPDVVANVLLMLIHTLIHTILIYGSCMGSFSKSIM